MAEHETNINQFAGVNALAKRIEELTKQRDEFAKDRQNSQTRLLEEHGVALADMKTTLDLLVSAQSTYLTYPDESHGLNHGKRS